MRGKQKIGLVCTTAIILAGACAWVLIREKILPITPQPVEVPGKTGAFISTGYGWSTKDNPIEAVQEAVSSVKTALGENEPEFALLFSTVKYDSNTVLGKVRSLLPNTKVYGGTSCLGVLTRDGFHVGANGSLAILGIYSTRIDFGVGGATMDELSAEEAGKTAIQAAIANAGRTGEIPQLVLMTAAPGTEEDILRGIDNITGGSVPVLGGSSADDDITGKWKQFANDNVYSNGVSLTAIFTDLKIGCSYEAGYLVAENMGVITNAAGRIIYEIDNQPAAEVYNTWTGGVVSEELVTGGTVLSKTTFWPLAKVLCGTGGEIYHLSIHPLSIDNSDRSLTVFADVDNGENISIMHGSWELLLNRAQITPTHALENVGISAGEGIFGIYTYCAGTMLAIPEDERPKMPGLIKNAIGNVPFIGTFTFGEQGYLEGVGNVHGNLVNSMIIFTEEE